MTVAQLRALLARLPQECQSFPVTYCKDYFDCEVVSVLVCPPDENDRHYPAGQIVLSNVNGDPDPDSGIRSYSPERT